MKVVKISLLILLLVISSCGTISVLPRACKTSANWGPRASNELYITQDYYIFTEDEEVLLKDILKKNNISCDQIDKLRMRIHSTFFIKRTIEIFYTANPFDWPDL